MNKDEFLKQLNNCLSALSPDERKDAIRYYIEYFDEAGKENETRILLELGSPEERQKQFWLITVTTPSCLKATAKKHRKM